MKLNEKPFLSRRDNRFSDELYHHGILGQKWGIRRFQNPDGSLTEAGKQRYLYKLGSRKAKKEYENFSLQNALKVLSGNDDDEHSKKVDNLLKDTHKTLREREGDLLKSISYEDFQSKVKDVVDSYVDKITKITLEDMKYSNDKESIEWLKKQPWYNESEDAYSMFYDYIM